MLPDIIVWCGIDGGQEDIEKAQTPPQYEDTVHYYPDLASTGMEGLYRQAREQNMIWE